MHRFKYTIVLCLALVAGIALVPLHDPAPLHAQAEGGTPTTDASTLVNQAGNYTEIAGLNPWSIPNRQLLLGYSPDGKFALTSGTSEIAIWNGRDGSLVWSLRTRDLIQDERERFFQFSHNSKMLLIAVGERWVIWDLETGRPVFADLLKDLKGGFSTFMEDDEEFAHIGINTSQPAPSGNEQHVTVIDLRKKRHLRTLEAEIPEGPIHMLRDAGTAVVYSKRPDYSWQEDSRGEYREFGFTQIDLGKGRAQRETKIKVHSKDYPGVDGSGKMIASQSGTHAFIPRGDSSSPVRGYIFDLDRLKIVRAVDMTPVRDDLTAAGSWDEDLSWSFPNDNAFFGMTNAHTLTFSAATGEATGVHSLPEARRDVRFEERYEQTRHLVWDPGHQRFAEVIPVLAGALDPSITTSDNAPHEVTYFSPDGKFTDWRDVTPRSSKVTLAVQETFDWMKVSSDGNYAVSWSSKRASQFVIRGLDGSASLLRPKPWPERDGWMEELQAECPAAIDPWRGVLLISPGKHTEKLGNKPVALDLKTGRAAPAIYLPPADGTITPIAWEQNRQRGLIDQEGLLTSWDYQQGSAAREYTEAWSTKDVFLSADDTTLVLVYPPMEESTRVVLMDAGSGQKRDSHNVAIALTSALVIDASARYLIGLKGSGDQSEIVCVDLKDGKVSFTLPFPSAGTLLDGEQVKGARVGKSTRFALTVGRGKVFVIDAATKSFTARYTFSPPPDKELSPGVLAAHTAIASDAGKLIVSTERGRYLVYDLMK